MRDPDSSKVESSSFSFLNFDWGDKINREPEDLVFPNVLDPNLKDYYIELGVCLQSLIEKSNPTFTYRLVDDFVVKIVSFSTGKAVLEISIVNFEMVEFFCVNNFHFTIILGREAFKRKSVSKTNKEYKKSVLDGVKITSLDNKYDLMMSKIFDIQIKNNHNFLFVDSPDDLTRDIKNIIKSLKSENKFVPKLKSFKPENNIEHFEEILCRIPGIGKCAARTISKKYKSFINFYSKLLNGLSVDLENLIIWDEENGKSRPLGKHQAEKIRRVFLSFDDTLLLNEN